MIRTLLLGLSLSLPLAGCIPLNYPEDPQWPGLQVQPGERLLHARLNGGAPVTLKLVGRNGDVETWMSQDRFSLSLDRGVLVATRGFTHDMMAGQSAETLAALSGELSESYTRRLRYLDSNEKSFWLQTECSVKPADETAGHSLQEICKGFARSYDNQFRLGADRSIISSKQWISPQNGYLELRYITHQAAARLDKTQIAIPLP